MGGLFELVGHDLSLGAGAGNAPVVQEIDKTALLIGQDGYLRELPARSDGLCAFREIGGMHIGSIASGLGLGAQNGTGIASHDETFPLLSV